MENFCAPAELGTRGVFGLLLAKVTTSLPNYIVVLQSIGKASVAVINSTTLRGTGEAGSCCLQRERK